MILAFRSRVFCRFVVLAPRGEKIWQQLQAFAKDESAATAIEYAIIAAGISIVIVAAVNGIGTKLNTTFSSVSTELK
jgi:pilus assembly protein Flp/PilA